MKIVQVLLILILTTTMSLAAPAPTAISSRIKKVTVFTQGAQVSRLGKASISKGNTTLKFDKLSPNINKQSLQVNLKGAATILSVSHRINQLETIPAPDKVKTLKDRIEVLNIELEQHTQLLQLYKQEEQLLFGNQKIEPKENSNQADDLRAMAELFRERLADLQEKRWKITLRNREINKEIAELQKELGSMKVTKEKPTSEIEVVVSAMKATSIEVTLSYLVSQAGWYPSYDLRVKNVASPLQVDYKAHVHQQTGVDWNDVKLTISSANPHQNGIQPHLSPWWIGHTAPGRKDRYKSAPAPAIEEADEDFGYSDDKAEDLRSVAEIPLAVTQVDKPTVVEFEIALPYSIPSDPNRMIVKMKHYEMKASYEYFSIPKLDKDAFLTARVTDWEQHQFLPGNANIYFEGTYVGKSALDANQLVDTLSISLGRDKQVVVTRTKIKDFTKRQVIGPNVKVRNGWAIEVRNQKKYPIHLVVKDQFPLTNNNAVEIDDRKFGKAEFNEESGELTWKFDLKPSKSDKVEFSYELKHPKHMRLYAN